MVTIPPFAALRAFEAIGRLRGIRRAAEELGISHPAVSKQLTGLEAQIGSTLFDRDARRLTDQGKAYHERIANALAEILRATQDVSKEGFDQLRISCAPGLALHWLTARLPNFQTDNKTALLVDLQTLDQLVDFKSDRVDGDIRYIYADALKQAEPGVRTFELASPYVFPVASPELIAKISGPVRSAGDLLRLPLIEERDQSEWEKWLACQGCSGRPMNSVARYGHAHLTIAAAKVGQGVALTNRFLAADDLSAGRLVRLVPHDREWPSVKLGSYVFRATTSKWDDYRVRRFRNWLVDEFLQAQRAFDGG